MKIYVVSKSGNRRFALLPENMLGGFVAGFQEDGRTDAKFAATEHTTNTGDATWVYEVELKAVDVFRTKRAVKHTALD